MTNMFNMFNEGDMVVFAEPPDGRSWPAHKQYYDTHSLESCVGTVVEVDGMLTLSLPYYVKWETIGGEYVGSIWCAERWLRYVDLEEKNGELRATSPPYNNSIGYPELDDFLSGFKS